MSKFSAKVIKGDGRGRQIGFPTLNLEYLGDLEGVYVAKILFNGREKMAAAHLGTRPTFNDAHQVCELHVIDYDEEIYYGDEIEVELFDQIRGVMKFKYVQELVEQIKRDVEFVKNWYNSPDKQKRNDK